jgi:hypothetical protein
MRAVAQASDVHARPKPDVVHVVEMDDVGFVVVGLLLVGLLLVGLLLTLEKVFWHNVYKVWCMIFCEVRKPLFVLMPVFFAMWTAVLSL